MLDKEGTVQRRIPVSLDIAEIVGELLAKYVKAREFLQCQYCPKSFSTKRGLKSHTTKAHKEFSLMLYKDYNCYYGSTR